MELDAVSLGTVALAAPYRTASFVVDLQHQLRRLGFGVPEYLLKDQGDDRHGSNRVVPDDHRPGSLRLLILTDQGIGAGCPVGLLLLHAHSLAGNERLLTRRVNS